MIAADLAAKTRTRDAQTSLHFGPASLRSVRALKIQLSSGHARLSQKKNKTMLLSRARPALRNVARQQRMLSAAPQPVYEPHVACTSVESACAPRRHWPDISKPLATPPPRRQNSSHAAAATPEQLDAAAATPE